MSNTTNQPTGTCIHWICYLLFPYQGAPCVWRLRGTTGTVIVRCRPSSTLGERTREAARLNRVHPDVVHVPVGYGDDPYQLVADCIDCLDGPERCDVCGGVGLVAVTMPDTTADLPDDVRVDW